MQESRTGALFYSTVNSTDINLPKSWSSPFLITQIPVSSSAIAYGNGNVYVAYSEDNIPSRVYITISVDEGLTWSLPIFVSESLSDEETLSDVDIVVDSNGTIHVFWAKYKIPEINTPLGIFYSRSVNDGQAWSTYLELDNGPFGLPNALVSPSNILYLVYNGSVAIKGRYFRYSEDSGYSWSSKIVIDPIVGGLTGNMLAQDSAQNLHFVSAADVSMNGIAYSTWRNNQWESTINIASQVPLVGGDKRQAYAPNILITNGNKLHVVYLGPAHATVYYISTELNTPYVASEPPNSIVTPVAEMPQIENLSDTTKVTPIERLSAQPLPSNLRNTTYKINNSVSTIIAAGVIPVVAMLFFVIIVKIKRRAQ
jgi:hypothetical protein